MCEDKRDFVLVTGATGEIGKAIAYDLASQDKDLILLSRKKTKLESLAKLLRQRFSICVRSIDLDYLHQNTIDRFAQFLMQEQCTISGLVLMTPRPVVSDLLFPSPTDWQSLFQSTFIGPSELTKSCIPHMPRDSKIVIMSGIASLQVMPNHPSAFGVVRSMWLAQAKALAHKLGPKGIHVNTVSPGGVMTDYMREIITNKALKNGCSLDEQFEKSFSNVPLRKYAQPEEVASVVQFLLSDQSSHLTGINIPCDGGFIQGY